jgi:hypothetical protein
VISAHWRSRSSRLSARARLTGRIVAYQRALPIRERLAAEDPGNADWKSDLDKLRGKMTAAATHIKEAKPPAGSP